MDRTLRNPLLKNMLWVKKILNMNLRNIPSSLSKTESTHSTPWSEARSMLRVDTERRFLPRFKNRGLAPSNVSIRE